MPGGDRAGPEGKGPKTGRGAGYCSGNEEPGYANDSPRRGFCFGGRGMGRRVQGRRQGGRNGGRGFRVWRRDADEQV
jgi:hypothetical protein